MWLLSLRDLQWRRRRFLVGIIGSGVVLGLTLLLAGISASFHNEASRSARALHADAWVVPAGDNGPFMSSATMSTANVPVVAGLPGVKAAEPVAILRSTIRYHKVKDIDVVGVPEGGFTTPHVADGRPPRQPGEITTNRSLHIPLGTTVAIGGRSFRVVGHTRGLSYRANVPTVYMGLTDTQVTLYAGQQLAATIVTKGVPTHVPSNFTVLSNAQVRSDMLGPLQNPIKMLRFVETLLWIVAAMVIGSIIYLSSLDRVRDFAVLKATGSSTRFLFGGLAGQALVVSGAAYILAAVMAILLAPRVPMPSEVPSSAYLLLIVVAVVVGLLASLSGLRRSVGADPAYAFQVA